VLNAVAGRLGTTAPVSFRVNPDVDPRTHPYIATGLKESKFGIAFGDAPALYRHATTLPHVAVRGIDCHIGSQITDMPAYAEATARMLELVDGLEADGIRLDHVDLGRIGIRYRDEVTIDPGTTRAWFAASSATVRTSCCSSPAGSWSATPESCSPACSISSPATAITSRSSTRR
jgi:diaminopimelate decarboxylase